MPAYAVIVETAPKNAEFIKTDLPGGQCCCVGAQLLGVVRQRSNQLLALRAQAVADGGGRHHFFLVAQRGGPLVKIGLARDEQGTSALGLKHAVDQGTGIAENQMLGNLLAARDVVNRQLVANNRVDQPPGMRGFIDFGQDATSQIAAACGQRVLPIRLHDFIQRVAMTGGIEQQQTFDRAAGTAQHGDLL